MTQTAQQVLDTVGYSGFVRALYNRTGDLSKDFTHAVLGLVTESHEYLTATDRVNAVEEVGDLTFYREALEQVLNDLSPINHAEADKAYGEIMDELSKQTSTVNLTEMHTEWLDLAKRWVGYGKAPTMPTSLLIAEATAMLTVTIPVGLLEDEDTGKVIITNVEKLLKRYNGMQFDSDRAVNRDIPAERKVLEASAG